MNKLTDDRLCEAIKNDSYIEVKDLKEMKKQPNVQELYLKLNKYEKLEAELGCPLEVVFKALEQGFVYGNVFTEDDFIKWEISHFEKHKVLGWCLQNISGVSIRFGQNGYEAFSHLESEVFLLKNYKQTWWLRNDKSE